PLPRHLPARGRFPGGNDYPGGENENEVRKNADNLGSKLKIITYEIAMSFQPGGEPLSAFSFQKWGTPADRRQTVP
ncbi:MAG: hypothetical protein LRY55_06800, partial [Leadbetterella sp.]|nr:hypothetical protein [Leadbetterella sp.]